jgi:tape measure domain-containing protein
MADIAELGVLVTSDGIEQTASALGGLATVGDKTEQSLGRVEKATRGAGVAAQEAIQRHVEQARALQETTRAAQVLDQQLATLTQLTKGLSAADAQTIAIAEGIARGLRERANAAQLSAQQIEVLAAAERALANATTATAPPLQQITDSTRALTLAQIQAIQINEGLVASSGHVKDAHRGMALAQVAAIQEDERRTESTRRLIAVHEQAIAEDQRRTNSLRQGIAVYEQAIAEDQRRANSIRQAIATQEQAIAEDARRTNAIRQGFATQEQAIAEERRREAAIRQAGLAQAEAIGINDRYTAAIARGRTSSEAMAIALGKVDPAARAAGGSVGGLSVVVQRLAAALTIREIIGYADAWVQVQSRLRLVSSSNTELATTQRRVFEVAQQTRTAFTETAETYTRLARNQSTLHATSEDLLTVTRAINESFVISGTSTQAQNAALLQLSQAFASGVLRGEELNSVLEQSPRLAEAIARGMGVTVGQLRAMGEAGKLSARSVFDAIKSQADAVSVEAAKIPLTVGQSLTIARNEFLKFVGELNDAEGGTAKLAGGIVFLSRHIGELVALVGIPFAARWLSGAVEGILGYGRGVLAATRAVEGITLATRAAAGASAAFGGAISFLGGPVGIAIAAAIAAITYALHKHGEASRAAKIDVDKYAASLGGLSAAALAAQQQTLGIAKLQEEANRTRLQGQLGALPSVPTSGYGRDASPVAAEGDRLRKEIAASSAAIATLDQKGAAVMDAYGAASKRAADEQKALSDAIRKANEARDAETAKLRVLNAAYGQSDEALALLSIRLDADIEKRKAKVGASAEEQKAIDRSIDAQTRQKEIALLNQQVAADTAKAIDEITDSLDRLIPQWTVNEKLLKDNADAQKYLNDQMKEVAAIGERNARAGRSDIDRVANEIKAAQKYADDIQRIWSDGFAKIITDGTKSFRDFFEDVLQMFSKLRAQMEQAGKGDSFGAKLLGLGSAAIGGGFAGYQVGQQLGSRSAGTVAGAGVGAATGFATAGPFGAAVGAFAGAIGGFIGASDAHKDAARALKEAAKNLDTGISAFATSNPVAGALLSNEVQRQKLQKDADAVYGIFEKTLQKLFGIDPSPDSKYGTARAEIDRIAAENAAKISSDFWEGINAQITALNGPAGAYANSLREIEKQYEANKASARALGGANADLIGIEKLHEAQIKALKAAYDEANKRVLEDFGTRKLSATGGTDRQLDDRRFSLAQERELYDLRQTGTEAAISALVELLALEAKSRDEEFAALNRRAQEDYRVRQLQAEGHTAEADALRAQLDQQREYQEAVKAGLDDATLAALALAQAAESARAAAEKASAAQRALEDLQVRALAAQGQNAAADQLRFQLQQQRELEEAQKSGQSQEYIQKLVDVLRLEAEARQRGTAGVPQVATTPEPYTGGERDAIANVAKGITEVTGNRLADYFASMLIVVKQIRDLIAAKPGQPTTANLTATVTPIPTGALPQTQQFVPAALVPQTPDASATMIDLVRQGFSSVNSLLADLAASDAAISRLTVPQQPAASVVPIAPTSLYGGPGPSMPTLPVYRLPQDTSSRPAPVSAPANEPKSVTINLGGITVNVTGETLPQDRASIKARATELADEIQSVIRQQLAEARISAGDPTVAGL